MDANSLQQVLIHTYSPDNNARKAAEESLKNLPSYPGGIKVLIDLAVNTQIERHVRQAASVTMKNIIQRHWSPNPITPVESGEVYLPEAEKAEYRPLILEALFRENDSSLRLIFAESVYQIARFDFPAQWPSLVDSLCLTIQSGNPERMYNALLALRKLVKIYEYKRLEDREPLNAIVTIVFPMLRGLFEQLLSNNSIQSAQMLQLICKTYWSCVQFHAPPFAANVNELTAWMNLLKQLLAKPLPEASEGIEPRDQPTDEEERDKWPWWRAKKWVARIFCRFYNRWGNPKNVEDEHAEMSTCFRNIIAPNILGVVMETLALRKNGRFCTNRVIQLCLTFMQNAIEPSNTYKLIKPHLPFLLFEVIHPVLCLTPADLELWEDDPHEFVRKSHDVFEDFVDPVMAASNLLADLSRKRCKDCLSEILIFYQQILSTYNSTPPEKRDYIQKDAALHALSALDSTLTKSKVHCEQVEPMLREHVLNEFENPNGFLRLRACRMFSRNFMRNVEFKQEDTLVRIVNGVLKCMKDPELPVRIEAAKTLRSLVLYRHSPIILDILRPLLPQILDQYFKLMDEIGNDEVVISLETIIDQFGDEIGPFSVQLVQKLVECFQQFANSGEDDDDAVMAAMQCLDAINTILHSIHNHPELYAVIAPHLLPVLSLILSSDRCIEYLDSALDILTSISYYSNTITKELWQAFPLLFSSFETWAWDYISNFVPVIDNFVGRDVAGFLNGSAVTSSGTKVSYLEMVFNMARVIFERTSNDEIEICCASRLFYSILHNCFVVRVDQCVPAIVETVCKKLPHAEALSSASVGHLFGVLGSAMHYNPRMTIETLEKLKITETVFKMWVGDMEKLRSVLEKKLFVLGVSSLMKVPFNELPPLIQNNMKPMIMQITVALKAMIQQENEVNHGEQEEEVDEESNFDKVLEQGGYDSNEDVEDVADDEYAQMLRELQQQAEEAFLDDVDDDDYSSALDAIDGVIFFVETLEGANKGNPQVYNQIQSELGPDFQTEMQNFLVEGQKRRELLLQQQQESSQ